MSDVTKPADKAKTQYPELTIETVDGAWILRQKGAPAKAFYRWESLVRVIEERITSKWDGAK